MSRILLIGLVMIAFGMTIAGCHGEVGGSIGKDKDTAHVIPGR